MFNIIGADGKQYGPVTGDQIRQWIREGRCNGATQVQSVGNIEWKPAGAVPEFADALGSVASQPPVASPNTYASRAANKIPAGVCGILLGALGVHKFILGYTGTGVLMLVTTLVGVFAGMLCCVTFLPAAAMAVIGVVEGILYLTKTDEEFVRTYVDGRKEWF